MPYNSGSSFTLQYKLPRPYFIYQNRSIAEYNIDGNGRVNIFCSAQKKAMYKEISNLYSWCVHFKLLEDSKGFFVEFICDSNVCYVWSIIVVQAVDVLHHTSTVCLDSCQDQQVLKVSATAKTMVSLNTHTFPPKCLVLMSLKFCSHKLINANFKWMKVLLQKLQIFRFPCISLVSMSLF